MTALRRYLTAMGFDPKTLSRRDRPAAIVDLVYSGGTFRQLMKQLYTWTVHVRSDWAAVCRELRFISIVDRYEQVPWPTGITVPLPLPREALHSVAVSLPFWDYLGNKQEKVAASHFAERWTDRRATGPPRSPSTAAALSEALFLFNFGRQRDERIRFIRSLSQCGALRHRTLRRLASELRFGRAGGRLELILLYPRRAWLPARLGAERLQI